MGGLNNMIYCNIARGMQIKTVKSALGKYIELRDVQLLSNAVHRCVVVHGEWINEENKEMAKRDILIDRHIRIGKGLNVSFRSRRKDVIDDVMRLANKLGIKVQKVSSRPYVMDQEYHIELGNINVDSKRFKEWKAKLPKVTGVKRVDYYAI